LARSISLEEFLAWDPPTPEPILGDFFAKGEKMVLFARSGSLKSMLTKRLGMAMSIGNNTKWLGIPTTKTGIKVIYLQFELSKARIHERFVIMTNKRPNTEGRFRIWNEPYLKIDTKEGLDILEAEIKELSPDVLIIDPILPAFTGNISDSTSVGLFRDALNLIADKYDLAIILIHHSRKSYSEDTANIDNMFGSMVLQAWPDVVINVQRGEKNRSELTIKFEKTRNSEDKADINVRVIPETLEFKEGPVI